MEAVDKTRFERNLLSDSANRLTFSVQQDFDADFEVRCLREFGFDSNRIKKIIVAYNNKRDYCLRYIESRKLKQEQKENTNKEMPLDVQVEKKDEQARSFLTVRPGYVPIRKRKPKPKAKPIVVENETENK